MCQGDGSTVGGQVYSADAVLTEMSSLKYIAGAVCTGIPAVPR